MVIAFIEWQGAAMLWGLAGLALPVIAHLLSRRGTRRIALPTARFLALAQAARGRRMRFSQWLLLLLRLALVALVVLAFARPAWREGQRREPGEGREVVIILDASASMSRRTAGRTPFEQARDRASEILDSLDPAIDRAGVVVAGLSAEALLPRLTANFSALRSMLGEIGPSPGSADLANAVGAAQRLPGAGGSETGARESARHLVLLTDAQAGHLADLAGVRADPGSPPLSIEAIGAGETANLAISALMVSSARPVSGASFTVAATVVNHGDRAATIEVICRTEPALAVAPSPALLTIEPRTQATALFLCRALEAGALRVGLAIPSDALEADNSVAATIPIHPAARVLILTDASTGAREAVRYLETALRPDDASPYEPRVVDVSRERADSIEWNQYELIVLCEAGAAPLEWLMRLHEFVAAGGGVWWLIDSAQAAAASDAYASIEPDAPSLPLAISGVAPAAAGAAWSSADLTHEALASFDGPPASALWAVRHARFALAEATTGAAVLIRAADGSPVVAAAQTGRGRVIMFNGSIASTSTDLTRLPLFPALVHEWMGWLGASDRAIDVLHPGRSAVLELPATAAGRASLTLEYVGTATQSAKSCNPIELDGRWSVAIEDLAEVGEVRVIDAGSGEWLAGASVTIDPRESDLRAADAAAITALQMVADEAAPGTARSGETLRLLPGETQIIELWPWLLAAACLAALMEGLIALAAMRREALA